MRHLILLLPLLLAGCGSLEVSSRWPTYPPPSNYPPPPPGSTGPSVAYEPTGVFPTALHIPKGHLPPPGSCRIWYPNLPPGQQPPPGNCAELASRVPAGAWLLTRPLEEREHVHVSVYDQSRPGVVIIIRVFDGESGRFIRDQRN